MSEEYLNSRYLERMLQAGIPVETASEIMLLLKHAAAARSAVRRDAIAGGWVDSERYSLAVRALGDGHRVIRETFGDIIYDRYLYAVMEPNAVLITGVPEESAESLVQIGDLVTRANGTRVFSPSGLREVLSSAADQEELEVVVRRQREARVLTLSVEFVQGFDIAPGYLKPQSHELNPDSSD